MTEAKKVVAKVVRVNAGLKEPPQVATPPAQDTRTTAPPPPDDSGDEGPGNAGVMSHEHG